MSAFSPAWLSLREHADTAARSSELLEEVRASLVGGPEVVLRDLGCGTGSMGRWLGARLPGPQHWILQDRDPELLDLAAATMPAVAADGSRVTMARKRADIAEVRAADLRGTSLVVASALLDLLTTEEVDGLVDACAAAGCPALLTLSVAGRVLVRPAEPLDREITDAFNAHQRRIIGGRRLLGPDAVETTRRAFIRRGVSVRSAPSPWRLGSENVQLTEQWLRGWVGAACEQRPELAAEASAYLTRRVEACRAGRLHVVVGHEDLLAVPGQVR